MKLLQNSKPLNKVSQAYDDDDENEGTFSPEVKQMIRKKVNSYLHTHIDISHQQSKQVLTFKKAKQPLPRQYPNFSTLLDLVAQQKSTHHLYKQKIERNLDECQYFYLKILSLAIDFECKVSEKQIDRQSSLMIDAFLFLASSLLEAGADKVSFYFSTVGIQYCEFVKVLHPIGQFLLILAKISRKTFRYKESILMLKKALEYNWWKDGRKSDQLNNHFIQWLQANSPDEAEIYGQKFQVARVFTIRSKALQTSKQMKLTKDLQLGVFRQLFQQFLDANRIKLDTVNYEIMHKRNVQISNQRAHDLEIQIYNELSFNFLQLNMKEQSKVFGEKYESGYIQPDNSKIISLSCQLIHSVQKRLSAWHRIDARVFELLFFVDIFELVKDQKSMMRALDQQNIIKLFKINYEGSFQSVLKKQMFQYEIPLPLQIRRDAPKLKRKTDGRKFIVKQRSVSTMNKLPVQVIKPKYTSDKVEQNLLLNYRGTGMSRLKLLNIFNRFIASAKQKQKQGSFRLIGWGYEQEQIYD